MKKIIVSTEALSELVKASGEVAKLITDCAPKRRLKEALIKLQESLEEQNNE